MQSATFLDPMTTMAMEARTSERCPTIGWGAITLGRLMAGNRKYETVMGVQVPEPVRMVIQQARKLGHELAGVKLRRSGHFRLSFAGLPAPIFMAATSGDTRALRNALSTVRQYSKHAKQEQMICNF